MTVETLERLNPHDTSQRRREVDHSRKLVVVAGPDR
jgi:hypothetical protein